MGRSGWKTAEVDLDAETLVFKRERMSRTQSSNNVPSSLFLSSPWT